MSARLMTVEDVAAFFQRSKRWVYRHADALGTVRDGGPLLFEQFDLDAYIQRHKQRTPELHEEARRRPRVDLPAGNNPVTGRPFGMRAVR